MPALFGDTLYCGLPDVSDKAPLNSPVFTGTPTCPTSTQTSSTNKELVNVEYLHNQGYATGLNSLTGSSYSIVAGGTVLTTQTFTYTTTADCYIHIHWRSNDFSAGAINGLYVYNGCIYEDVRLYQANALDCHLYRANAFYSKRGQTITFVVSGNIYIFGITAFFVNS